MMASKKGFALCAVLVWKHVCVANPWVESSIGEGVATASRFAMRSAGDQLLSLSRAVVDKSGGKGCSRFVNRCWRRIVREGCLVVAPVWRMSKASWRGCSASLQALSKVNRKWLNMTRMLNAIKSIASSGCVSRLLAVMPRSMAYLRPAMVPRSAAVAVDGDEAEAKEHGEAGDEHADIDIGSSSLGRISLLDSPHKPLPWRGACRRCLKGAPDRRSFELRAVRCHC